MAVSTYLLAVVTVQLVTVWTPARPEVVGVTCEAADRCKDDFVRDAQASGSNFFDKECGLLEIKIRCYRNVKASCPADTRPYAESDLQKDVASYTLKCSAPFTSAASWIVLGLGVLVARWSSRHV